MNLSRFLRFAREFHIAPGPGPSAAARSGDNNTYIHTYIHATVCIQWLRCATGSREQEGGRLWRLQRAVRDLTWFSAAAGDLDQLSSFGLVATAFTNAIKVNS